MRAQLAAGQVIAANQAELVAFLSTNLSMLEASVSGLSAQVSGHSTTISTLKPVATTGVFKDLTQRPSAVSAITVLPEVTSVRNCQGASGWKEVILGAESRQYCALSLKSYIPRP